MNIRFTRNCFSRGVAYREGQVVELEDHEAKALISSRRAVPAKAPVIETREPAVETRDPQIVAQDQGPLIPPLRTKKK